MEEWDQTAKQLKSKAELLESVCQDKLTHLYQDKRKARKTYQEEHSKIAAQFTTVSNFFFFTMQYNATSFQFNYFSFRIDESEGKNSFFVRMGRSFYLMF